MLTFYVPRIFWTGEILSPTLKEEPDVSWATGGFSSVLQGPPQPGGTDFEDRSSLRLCSTGPVIIP